METNPRSPLQLDCRPESATDTPWLISLIQMCPPAGGTSCPGSGEWPAGPQPLAHLVAARPGPGPPTPPGFGCLLHPLQAPRRFRGRSLAALPSWGPASLWAAAGGRLPPRRRCGYSAPRGVQGPGPKAALGRASEWSLPFLQLVADFFSRMKNVISLKFTRP